MIRKHTTRCNRPYKEKYEGVTKSFRTATWSAGTANGTALGH